MRHHFQDHRYGFGVSSPIWDVVFQTLPRRRAPAAARRAEDQPGCRRRPRPSSTAITLSATARAMPSRDGTVAEPMCGSSTQRGASSSRGETSGSFS